MLLFPIFNVKICDFAVKLQNKIDDFAELQSIFMNFVECNGDLIDDYQCSCCGDYVTTHKINI